MVGLLQKNLKEEKTKMSMGDFNIDLLKYDTNASSTAFLDSMYTIFFSLTSQPQCGLQHTQKLIDNIFLKNSADGLTSGNITLTISNYFAQFLLQKDKIDKNKPNLFTYNFKSLNEASLDFELRQMDWSTIPGIDKNNFLLIFNHLLQQHAPLEKNSNKEIQTLKKNLYYDRNFEIH